MPSLKEVRNRIVSVNSTQQITKAMKMVSAAKLRRATDAIIQMRPYSQKLTEMIATVSSNAEGASENPYTTVREINKVLIIAVTSDRGLCGAFNANVGKIWRRKNQFHNIINQVPRMNHIAWIIN